MWLDENNDANRKEAVKILAKSEYVGADPEVIANSMTGTFEYEKGDKRPVPEFNVFFRYFANYPYYLDAVCYMSPKSHSEECQVGEEWVGLGRSWWSTN